MTGLSKDPSGVMKFCSLNSDGVSFIVYVVCVHDITRPSLESSMGQFWVVVSSLWKPECLEPPQRVSNVITFPGS